MGDVNVVCRTPIVCVLPRLTETKSEQFVSTNVRDVSTGPG